MEISIPEQIRFLLLGAGDLARFTLSRLPEHTDAACLISNAEWDKAWSSDNSTTIFDLADEVDIPRQNAQEYTEVIDYITREKPNVCLTIGSRWIFKNDFLSHFNGLVFNYHPSDLPRHRGGGVYSWQILHGIEQAAVTIHQMTDKVDAGPIVLQRRRDLKKHPYPVDFDAACVELAQKTIVEFLELLGNNRGDAITLTEQSDEASTYFPLLKSGVNGAIDFNWKIDHLERFIRAFSYPYPGAFTVYRKKTIQIMEADILDRDEYHPFAYGLVTAVLDDGDAKIACRGGSLRVQKIKLGEKLFTPAEILKAGWRLWTPIEYLDKSRHYRPKP